MLIDTDVLIWYLRGNEKAKKIIEEQDNFSISVVTYMELVQGMRNKSELLLFRKALHNWGVRIIYLDEDISIKAMNYIEQFYLSHSLELADSLIASTAFTKGLTLLTGNSKHFAIIKGIEVKNFKP
jgi:predicted nucleic acid-binding protein